MYWSYNKETGEPQFHTNMKLASEATDFSYDQLTNAFGRKKLTELENEKFYVGKEDHIPTIMKSFAKKINPSLEYVGDYSIRFDGETRIVKFYAILEDNKS